jgi:hypothetical protein
MQITPQITFEGSESFDAARDVITREIARLETHNKRITGCRVTVIAPSHKHRHGTVLISVRTTSAETSSVAAAILLAFNLGDAGFAPRYDERPCPDGQRLLFAAPICHRAPIQKLAATRS